MSFSSLNTSDRFAKLKEIREEFRWFDRTVETNVQLVIEAHIATITLNNARRLNSLTGKMMAELADVLDNLEQKTLNEQSTLIGVIMEGSGGRNFCAGFDLDLAQDKFQTSESGEKLCALMMDNYERFRRLPLVSVCAIEGYALGGGAELATASDFRIAAVDSVVRFLHRNIGTVPGWGGATRLNELMGYSDSLYYMATTQPLPVPELGRSNSFFSLICNTGKANEASRNFLNAFIPDKVNPQATRNIKSMVSRLRSANSTEEKLNIEITTFTSLWGSPMNLLAIAEARKSKGSKDPKKTNY